MSIDLQQPDPLILLVSEERAGKIDNIDVGTAFTAHLHEQVGDFEEAPLSKHAELISTTVNPRSHRYRDQEFEYVDLREVDDVYGQLLMCRRQPGSAIGSAKKRFRQHDILFARIMPSLANKKIALVTDEITNGVASTFSSCASCLKVRSTSTTCSERCGRTTSRGRLWQT
jgi:type I restriction enzyme S subunit